MSHKISSKYYYICIMTTCMYYKQPASVFYSMNSLNENLSQGNAQVVVHARLGFLHFPFCTCACCGRLESKTTMFKWVHDFFDQQCLPTNVCVRIQTHSARLCFNAQQHLQCVHGDIMYGGEGIYV